MDETNKYYKKEKSHVDYGNTGELYIYIPHVLVCQHIKYMIVFYM